jgi:hypothetical protein
LGPRLAVLTKGASTSEGLESFAQPAAITIDPKLLGIVGASIKVDVARRSTSLVEYSAGPVKLVVRTHGTRRTVDDCLQCIGDWLLDVIVSKTLVCDAADLLLARSSTTRHIWLMSITWDGSVWSCNAVDLEASATVSTSYALSDPDEQLRDLAANHRYFMALAGDVLFGGAARRNERVVLRIKVDRQNLWILRFAFGAFAKFQLRGFDAYKACQLIVTGRAVSEVATRQTEVEFELANIRTFLEGSYIVLNTYKSHTNAGTHEVAKAALALLIEVFDNLQNLRFPSGTLSLNWTMNPSATQLRTILLSPRTRFLFGDFEAAGGVWSLGDGEHRCSAACGHSVKRDLASVFDLSGLRGRLSHIRLMRVFHCNSLFDPYRAGVEPADDATLAAALLATGAYFVEGSLTEESVVDCLCTILTLVLGRADVQAIMFAKSLAGECDVSSLTARANEILAKREFPVIV